MKKQKIIVYSCLILFTLASLFFLSTSIFVTGKRIYWNRAQKKGEEWQSRREELLDLKKKSREWQSVETEYAQFRKEYVLPKTDFAAFRQDIESLIQNNGLTKISLTFGQKAKTQIKTEMLRFRLELTGDYNQLKKFIYDLEGLSTIIFCKQLNLRNQDGMIFANLEMETHFAL